MDSCELAVSISLIACGIAKCYSDDEVALLSSIFSQLGDTLATIAANNELNEDKCENPSNDKTGNNSSKNTNSSTN